MNKINCFAASLATCVLSFSLLHAQPFDKWQKADSEIQRLEPKEFKELSPEVIKNLNDEGCQIPQTYVDKNSHNVIKGEFAKKGQIDWAVLCSKNSKSVIHVFWGGPANCPSKWGERSDSTYLQVISGDGAIGFSRMIVSVGPEYIKNRNKDVADLKEIHNGINDAFTEKASTVHYCSEGKWIKLAGAD
jgi:hypothetical protein